MPRGFALFDLDHTLLPFDTQALFCNFVLRREGWRRIYLIWYLPSLLLGAIRLFKLRTMKRVFCSYLWGMPAERLAGYVDEFLATDFDEALFPEVVAEVARHREEGRLLVLNSASPEFYLLKIGEKLGFDHSLGTKFIVPDVMPWLPQIEGPNNKHEEKIVAMVDQQIIPEDYPMLPDSWAYSDSSADIPLLSIAENGVMIHPGAALEQEGLKHGWRTMTPRRPYVGTWAGRFAMLRQAFGLYQLPKKDFADA